MRAFLHSGDKKQVVVKARCLLDALDGVCVSFGSSGQQRSP